MFGLEGGENYMLVDGGCIHFYKQFMGDNFSKELFIELLNLDFEQPELDMFGKTVKIPRLQCWMSDDNVKACLYQKQPARKWSEKVFSLKTFIENAYNFKFDYVLINLYRNGDDYISYHSDREAIGNGKNIVAGVSLGSTRKFSIKHNNSKQLGLKPINFELQNGSLILMIGDNTQLLWKHSIPKTKTALGPRINLTFRHS